jgi:hypothetical protein
MFDSIAAHEERLEKLRTLKTRKRMLQGDIQELESEIDAIELFGRLDHCPVQPYSPPEASLVLPEWSDEVTNRNDLTLYISPTDVLVRVLHKAFKPSYVKSVHYTVDATLQTLTLDIRFGAVFYLMVLFNPFFLIILPLWLKHVVSHCDLMPEVTTLKYLEVDFSWVSPGFAGIEDIRSQAELVDMTLQHDQRLYDSYVNRQVALLPWDKDV